VTDHALMGFLQDPDAIIIAVVTEIESDLTAAELCSAIDQAAPTRAQRRRLAHALHQHPDLLISGHPQGPPQIERLIRALQATGAHRVALPRCGHCQRPKPLTQLDGKMRICGSCDRRRRSAAEPCAACGVNRAIASRDRDGRPVCVHCVSYQSHDPVEEISTTIVQLDPAQDPQLLAEIIQTAIPQQFQRHQVLRELQDRPELLTGQGAYGSARVNALIQALVSAGIGGVVAPACPSCGRIVPLVSKHRDGRRCCSRCYDHQHHAPCSRCGRSRRVCSRTAAGEAVCGPCYRRDQANHAPCADCGRVTIVHRHDDQPARCERCFQLPLASCSLCGQVKPCHFAATERPRCKNCSRRMRPLSCTRCRRTRPVAGRSAEGEPLCGNCARRPEPCIGCGRTRLVKGRATEGPLCATCYPKHPVSFRPCTDCGVTERLHHHGLCQRCAFRQQLLTLLAHPGGDVHPHIEPIFHALVANKPKSALAWLERSPAAALLHELSQLDQPLTHQILDRYEPHKAIDYLRNVLVAGKVLPPRDEYLVMLDRWAATAVARVVDPAERRIVRGFVSWHQLRRLRDRSQQHTITAAQGGRARAEVRAAIALISWLHDNGATLATCDQHLIDRWLADGRSTNHNARAFLLWTHRNRHTSAVTIPHRPLGGLGVRIEDDERWALVRRFLHDDAIAITDRVAGLLLLLYGQPLTKVAHITREQILSSAHHASIMLGAKPLELQEPVSELVLRLVNDHRSRAAIGHTHDHPWLFPGAAPGRPISPRTLMTRLQAFGVRARAGRNTTLMDLAALLPAVVLSKLLGIGINTATSWTQRAQTGAAYAAEVARRQNPNTSH
jgi:hypothetical protein